jgi:hypothetical protein
MNGRLHDEEKQNAADQGQHSKRVALEQYACPNFLTVVHVVPKEIPSDYKQQKKNKVLHIRWGCYSLRLCLTP